MTEPILPLIRPGVKVKATKNYGLIVAGNTYTVKERKRGRLADGTPAVGVTLVEVDPPLGKAAYAISNVSPVL